METRFKIGDRIWFAFAGTREIEVACPVCFGQLAVTLILGNGDELRLPCDYCSKGYSGPRGVIADCEFVAQTSERMIDRVSVGSRGDAREIEVEYQCDCTIIKDENCFASDEEAMARAREMVVEQLAERRARMERIKHDHAKSYSWNAGYHMRQAKDLRHRLEHHERMAVLAKAKAKQEKSESKETP